MKDYEIALNKKMVPIVDIAKKINISADALEQYGNYKAKIMKVDSHENGGLVLVTATNPTPLGEGKTTVSIGLNDAFRILGVNSICSLREPSMGPVFGIKGGATGGGMAQVLPMDEINLHFTGDFHAITSANNLICAIIDNSIKQGNPLDIDLNNITFKRCLDMNDRALREVEVARGGKINGTPRIDGFNITVASEIMAVFCLATDLNDLKRRIDKIIIGKNTKGKDLFVSDLGVTGSVVALLKNAMKPNLVQSLEENPVIIHGGPFANIAHGCCSIIATNMARNFSNIVIEEAGFGADLGALKFFDIKCRKNNINPLGVVLVTTLRALKYNGGGSVDEAKVDNKEFLVAGLPNLEVHMENLSTFTSNIVVTLNKFTDDSDSEIQIIKDFVESKGHIFIVNNVFGQGGAGAVDLAKEILKWQSSKVNELYDLADKLETKINTVCKKIYRAKNVNYSDLAKEKLAYINKNYGGYPICIAKTQYSISDNKDLLAKPSGHTMTVRDLVVYNGAEFITVLMGDIMTMPGLGKEPAALSINVDDNENIVGIF